jgi:hypothetical protein
VAVFDFMDSIGNVAGYSKYLLIPSDPGRFDKQLAEIADRAVRRSSFDAMRPAALAPADGPVGAVEHGSEFFNGIELLKGGGSQPFLDTGPISRRQRLLNALLWDGNCADMNSRSADHRRFD